MKYNMQGFSLVELMIALLISTVLMIGVSSAYSSIRGLVNTSKNLENAQEVIRFTADVFTRSLKQTEGPVTIAGGGTQITIPQNANSIACDGNRTIGVIYDEVYSHNGINLRCDTGQGDGARIILTGIRAIRFNQVGNLVEITVTPKAQLGEPDDEGAAKAIQIDIALTGVMLTNLM